MVVTDRCRFERRGNLPVRDLFPATVGDCVSPSQGTLAGSGGPLKTNSAVWMHAPLSTARVASVDVDEEKAGHLHLRFPLVARETQGKLLKGNDH